MPVMVLPHPDSPTMPTVSPGSTSKLRPSTACTVAFRSRISVFRFRTSSSLATGRYLAWRRTLKESCRASPMKLKATTVTTMIARAG